MLVVDDPDSASPSLLDLARELALRETGLAVVVTYRADGSAHASVVNAGVLQHPVSGDPVVGFVVQGRGRKKLDNLRRRRAATVVFRSGWDWVAIEGRVDLIGPDDRDCLPWPDARAVFHEIYSAAIGGSPDDWAGRDAAIEEERHAAVLVRPARVYSDECVTPRAIGAGSSARQRLLGATVQGERHERAQPTDLTHGAQRKNRRARTMPTIVQMASTVVSPTGKPCVAGS